METVGMLNTDAMRSAEAAQSASLEALRADTARRTERVKALKAKTMLISAENVSKQELVDSLSTRLEEMSKELSRMSLLQAKDQVEKHAQDQKAISLQNIFDATLQRAISSQGTANIHSDLFAAHAAQTGPRHTPLYLCPGGEARDESEI